MIRRKDYRDQEKARKTMNAQRKRYYQKTAWAENGGNGWTLHEDEAVLAHNVSDAELSAVLGRSVQSIQVRRWRLKRF